MESESFIRAFAGTVVLVSVLLAWFASPWWLLLTAFVAINLIQSAFTDFCPPSLLLRRLGWLDHRGVIRWGGQKTTSSDPTAE